MTKPEIVQQVLNDFRNESERAHIPERSDVDYEAIILSALEKSLQAVEPGADIRTCEDFELLNVTCCESCHGLHQHYEMSLVETESADNAWICCAVDRALRPAKYANLYQLPKYMTFDEMLTAFIRKSEDA
jgi:hypothetical protein